MSCQNCVTTNKQNGSHCSECGEPLKEQIELQQQPDKSISYHQVVTTSKHSRQPFQPLPDNPNDSRTTLEPEYPELEEINVQPIVQDQNEIQLHISALDIEVAKEKELCWADGCGQISTT